MGYTVIVHLDILIVLSVKISEWSDLENFTVNTNIWMFMFL